MSLIDTIDWAPVVATRGYGMLIESKRIGLYSQIEHKKEGRFWAVGYLMFEDAEYKTLVEKAAAHAVFEHGVSYDDDQMSECATVTRAYLASRKAAYGKETLHWVGYNLPWIAEKYPITVQQETLLKFHVWTKACIES